MSIPNVHKPSSTPPKPRTVWDLYNEKARVRDKALLKDWDSSINSLLLFAAIFAAVLTALCVESRKLLEPDPLSAIEKTLLYIAERNNDPTARAPSPPDAFVPEDWAVVVNGFFFTSLTTSILAAVGAVTCLQWVGEYDAGLEAASTPKHRALRCHYRYRSIDQWYMRHMIASLPIILYLAVGFFFTGLTVWFWHLYTRLSFIPLMGLIIWASGYIITTAMAALRPSAPYRTAVSKALFRIFSLAMFFIWKYAQTAIILYRPLLKFLRHPFHRSKTPWNEYRNEFILEKIEFSRQMKQKSKEQYPWMPVGRDYWQSMHSHVWEQGRVDQDKTLQLSTIAWLANTTDLSEHSIPCFHIILKELNSIPEDMLREWPEYNYDAPWSHIFNMVISPSSMTEGLDLALHPGKILPTLAQLLQKMSHHPTLFERMVQELDSRLIVEFMQQLASEPPAQKKSAAQKRLKSITSLLSSKKWDEMIAGEQPVMHVFKAIQDCLDVMLNTSDDPDIATSWIFTLCRFKEPKDDAKASNGKASDATALIKWPNPELIRLIHSAFENRDLRERAVIYYLQFADAIFSGTELKKEPRQHWRWKKEMTATDENRLAIIKILGRHLLWTFFVSTEPLERQASEDRFNGFLDDNAITNPALKLILMAFGGYQHTIDIPAQDDNIWNDEIWHYAISEWYRFHTHYANEVGNEVPSESFLRTSASIMTKSKQANDVAVDALIGLSTRFPSPSRFWICLLESIETDPEIIQAFTPHTIELSPEQWLRIFTHFHSKEGSASATPVTTAMLRTLRVSLKRDLIQIRWQQAIASTAAANSSQTAPTTMTRLLRVVNALWRRESHDQRSRATLAFGMLTLINDVLRTDDSNPGSPEFDRPRACVSAVDELALAYASGTQRDPKYTRLFADIANGLIPMVRRFTVHPNSRTSMVSQHGASEDALSWPLNLQATMDHASHAGGIKRTETSESISLDVVTRPAAGTQEMQNISQDRSVRVAFLRRINPLVSTTSLPSILNV